MTFKAGDLLILKKGLRVYHISRVTEHDVEVFHAQMQETWIIPHSILNALPQAAYIHIALDGSIFTDYPELRELGWDRRSGKTPLTWLIDYIKRLENLLKETTHAGVS